MKEDAELLGEVNLIFERLLGICASGTITAGIAEQLLDAGLLDRAEKTLRKLLTPEVVEDVIFPARVNLELWRHAAPRQRERASVKVLESLSVNFQDLQSTRGHDLRATRCA